MEGGVTGDESRLRPLVGAPGVVAYPGNIGPPLARSRGAYTTGRHRYTDNDNDADRRSSSVLACAVVAVGAHRRARDRVFQGIPVVVSLRSSIYFFFFLFGRFNVARVTAEARYAIYIRCESHTGATGTGPRRRGERSRFHSPLSPSFSFENAHTHATARHQSVPRSELGRPRESESKIGPVPTRVPPDVRPRR